MSKTIVTILIIPKKDNFNLKKMVMHEIQNCSNEKLNKVKLILQNTESLDTEALKEIIKDENANKDTNVQEKNQVGEPSGEGEEPR